MTAAPSRKPKLYRLPLLCTSYIWTAGLKREAIKVPGEMIPWKTPVMKPAVRLSESLVFTNELGPGT